jgi:hypothetical protein
MAGIFPKRSRSQGRPQEAAERARPLTAAKAEGVLVSFIMPSIPR